MNFFCEDLFVEIVLFLSFDDIIKLKYINKHFNNLMSKNYIWKMIGRRDKPYLNINNEIDYVFKSPFYVFDQEIKNYIQNDSWASKKIEIKRINSNGFTDHRIKAYVESMVKNMIIVQKLRELNRPDMCLDWKISLTKTIESYLDLIEKENDELELISRDRHPPRTPMSPPLIRHHLKRRKPVLKRALLR